MKSMMGQMESKMTQAMREKLKSGISNQEVLGKEDAGNDSEEELIKIFQNLTRLHFMTHTSQHLKRYCHPRNKIIGEWRDFVKKS